MCVLLCGASPAVQRYGMSNQSRDATACPILNPVLNPVQSNPDSSSFDPCSCASSRRRIFGRYKQLFPETPGGAHLHIGRIYYEPQTDCSANGFGTIEEVWDNGAWVRVKWGTFSEDVVGLLIFVAVKQVYSSVRDIWLTRLRCAQTTQAKPGATG